MYKSEFIKFFADNWAPGTGRSEEELDSLVINVPRWYLDRDNTRDCLNILKIFWRIPIKEQAGVGNFASLFLKDGIPCYDNAPYVDRPTLIGGIAKVSLHERPIIQEILSDLIQKNAKTIFTVRSWENYLGIIIGYLSQLLQKIPADLHASFVDTLKERVSYDSITSEQDLLDYSVELLKIIRSENKPAGCPLF